MARRSKPADPETLRKELLELITNFEKKLLEKDLRSKVIALVPAYRVLRDLGSSLIPVKEAKSARDRILAYFRHYPNTVISGEELSVVAGINDWPRRVRELRVEFGWPIATGVTINEIFKEADEVGQTEEIKALEGMPPHDYILLEDRQDRDAAYRWKLANDIRKQKISARDKILLFLRENIGVSVSGEEISYVANITDWPRRVRELRTEYGWPVVTKQTGRPDLSVGVYLLEMDRQAPVHDRLIPDPVRVAVLRRDAYQCLQCSWHISEWNRADPRILELHHKKHHAKGGDNTEENLITLCNICHDEIHRQERTS
jgi:hypothetical protein